MAMARLKGALSGERYCHAGVGENDDWKIPSGPQPFPLQDLVGRVLLKLREDEYGNWHPYKNEQGFYVESPAPVTGFQAHDGMVRKYGCLAHIMDSEGWVKVLFGTKPLFEQSEDVPLIDLSGVSTPPTPRRY